jgi:hypothetical protein
MSAPVSSAGSAFSSLMGFTGSPIGSLVQNPSIPKHKGVFSCDKGQIQVECNDILTQNLMNFYLKEFYPKDSSSSFNL